MCAEYEFEAFDASNDEIRLMAFYLYPEFIDVSLKTDGKRINTCCFSRFNSCFSRIFSKLRCMMFAYKRISSLGPSHDPTAYMAETGRRSSTQTRNTIVCTNTGSEIQKQISKWRESSHL